MTKKRILSQAERDRLEHKAREIDTRAESRRRTSIDPFSVDWQATLELVLLMMEQPFLDQPGELLPMQIDGHDEWEFYVEIEAKLDLPPDTCAVLVTPSAFKDMPVSFPEKAQRRNERPKNTYSVLIKDLLRHETVMQVSLPGLESVGIDVFDDGNHAIDYSYETIEECQDDLNKIVWMFFSPKGAWSEEQMIRYTENWYAKSLHTLAIEEVPIHTHYSYLHHPDLIGISPLSGLFRIIAATIPKEYDGLEEAIELANDLNQELGLPVITIEGILNDDEAQAGALLSRIIVEIDQNLDNLDHVDGLDFPERSIKNPAFEKAFDDCARQVYHAITGRPCPEGLKVE